MQLCRRTFIVFLGYFLSMLDPIPVYVELGIYLYFAAVATVGLYLYGLALRHR